MGQTDVGIGIIGGGLMGREAASAFGRWFVLKDFPVRPRLLAVADPSEPARQWFSQISTAVKCFPDHGELLGQENIDVVYVAVPHNQHQAIYADVLMSGKDLLAEKPFGIDLVAARQISEKVRQSARFVRCSSEFPFFPGAQAVIAYARQNSSARILEVNAGFLHSSDLDPIKPSNWKRQCATCGEIGVMGDLGLHVLHIPFRIGWRPKNVFAQLQKGYPERPDGKGGVVTCDTWDNAILHCEVQSRNQPFPMRLEMKRLAPGQMNTWYIEILGTERGIRYSTSDTKAIYLFDRSKGQSWSRVETGFGSAFSTSTGGIFEAGFPDVFLQMWAAFLAERAGALGDRFGCVTPDEALDSHVLFQAALESWRDKRAIECAYGT